MYELFQFGFIMGSTFVGLLAILIITILSYSVQKEKQSFRRWLAKKGKLHDLVNWETDWAAEKSIFEGA